MRQKCVRTLALLTWLCALAAPAQVIRVQVVRTADNDGTNSAATITADQVASDLAIVNKWFQATGLEFVFDKTSDFESEVRNDTLLNRDFVIFKDAKVDDPKKPPPQKYLEEIVKKRIALSKQYRSKLVLFYGHGATLAFSESAAKWEIRERNASGTTFIDPYVLVRRNADALSLAQELASFFHVADFNGEFSTAQIERIKRAISGNRRSIAGAKNMEPWKPGPAIIVNTADNELRVISVGVDQSLRLRDCHNNFGWHPSCDKKWTHWAGVVVDSVAAVAWNPYKGDPRLDVFVRDDKRGVLQRTVAYESYPPNYEFTSVGGDVTAAPSVVSIDRDTIYLFALGSDNAVWYKVLKDEQWWPSQVEWAPAYGKFVSPPLAVIGAKNIDVFAIGFNGHLYWRTYDIDRNSWYPSDTDYSGRRDPFPWTDLGGDLQGNPAVERSWGRVDIVARGKDNQLWHKINLDGHWYPSQYEWTAIGGATNHSPAIASLCFNSLDVVMVGLDNAIYHKSLTFPTGWSPSLTGWNSFGGKFAGDPIISSRNCARLDIVVRDEYGVHWHKTYEKGAWAPPGEIWKDLCRYAE